MNRDWTEVLVTVMMLLEQSTHSKISSIIYKKITADTYHTILMMMRFSSFIKNEQITCGDFSIVVLLREFTGRRISRDREINQADFQAGKR